MTKKGKTDLLKAQLVVAEAKLSKVMEEQGEACGDACDWHDNNAYDLAMSLANTYQALVDDLKREI